MSKFMHYCIIYAIYFVYRYIHDLGPVGIFVMA